LDGSKKVDAQEFKQCFEAMGIMNNVTDDDIKYLIKKYDTSHDGEVAWEDFVRIFEDD